MKMNTGDIVKIVDTGHIYPSYRSFFKENGFQDLVSRHRSYPGEEKIGRIVFSGLHIHSLQVIYAIEVGDDSRIVLVGEHGVELVSSGQVQELPDISNSDIPVSDLLGI